MYMICLGMRPRSRQNSRTQLRLYSALAVPRHSDCHAKAETDVSMYAYQNPCFFVQAHVLSRLNLVYLLST